VFGPFSKQNTRVEPVRVGRETNYDTVRLLAAAAVEELSAIPDALRVGDEQLPGRDVLMAGDTLDLEAIFGGHEEG
jgi:hypothetical protein